LRLTYVRNTPGLRHQVQPDFINTEKSVIDYCRLEILLCSWYRRGNQVKKELIIITAKENVLVKQMASIRTFNMIALFSMTRQKHFSFTLRGTGVS